MKKAMIVSFFKSNNLGDLALSHSIEQIITNQGYSIEKIDFPTVSFIENSFTMLNHDLIIEKKNIDKSKKKILQKKIKQSIKAIIGESQIKYILYIVSKLKNTFKWNIFKKKMRDNDILVIGGGNMIMDTINTWPDIFHTYCKIAKKLDKEVYILYVGAGPVNNDKSKKIYKETFKYAEKISVRDPLSKKVCENIAEKKISIVETIDPVFSILINSYEQRMSTLNELKKTLEFKIGICIIGKECFNTKNDYDKYLLVLKKMLNCLVLKSSGTINFVLFSTEALDYIAINEFYSMVNNYRNISIVEVEKINDVIDLYENLHYLIGGRMHSLIFAQKCLLPFLGIVWQDKINGFGQVTNSSNRIFEVSLLYKSIETVADDILGMMINPKVIINMNETNKALLDLVELGSIS